MITEQQHAEIFKVQAPRIDIDPGEVVEALERCRNVTFGVESQAYEEAIRIVKDIARRRYWEQKTPRG